LQRFLFIFLFLVIGLFGAILVAPNFINWNEYREVFAKKVYHATGFNLEIRGDIKIEILPSPALLINDVHVANIEGAMTSDTLMVKKLEVKIALIPLLGRQLQFTSVKLVQPIMNIEILSDGRTNMSIKPPNTADPKLSDFNNSKTPDRGPKSPLSLIERSKIGSLTLKVDDFIVQNGFVKFHNAQKGQTEKIEKLNGRFSLASFAGPMESSGSAVIKGLPINYALSFGAILQDRTLPFNLKFNSILGATELRFLGALTQIDKNPTIKGKLNFNTNNLAKFVSSINSIPNLSSSFSRKLSIETLLTASAKKGNFSDLIIKLDGTQGTGNISFRNRERTEVNISISGNKLDIDSLLTPTILVAKPNARRVEENISKETIGKISPKETPARPVLIGSQINLESLPKELNVMLDLSFAAIIYNRAVVRQFKINASLEDQEITISQASALLPGSADLGVQGIIFNEKKSERPQFEGTADLTTNNLRTLINWIGVNVPDVPNDRLRKLTVGGKIIASIDKLLLKDISARIDSTSIKGAVAMILSDRPFLDVKAAIGQLNLDGYLSGRVTNKNKSKAPDIASTNLSAEIEKIEKVNNNDNFLTTSSFLNNFSANIDLRMDTLVFENLPIKKTMLRAKLIDGSLILSNLKISSLAGLSVKLAGNISDIGIAGRNFNPNFNKLQFDVRGKNPLRILRLLKIKTPASIGKTGPLKFSGLLKGNPSKIDLLAKVSLFGGRFNLDGRIEPLLVLPRVKGRFSLLHSNLSGFLKKIGVNYRPRNPKFGGINLKGDLDGNLAKLIFSDLTGKLGNIDVQGVVVTELIKKIPRIVANLKTSTITIDDILPVKHTALTDKSIINYHKFAKQKLAFHPRIIRVSHSDVPVKLFSNPLIASKVEKNIASGAPWTDEPIDLSFIRQFSGNIKLRSNGLKFSKYHISNVNLISEISNGVLELKRLSGHAYDGTVEMDGQIDATDPENKYKTRFKVVNINTGKFLSSLGSPGFRKGALDMSSEFYAQGSSTHGMISKLDGSGTISIRGLEISPVAGKGSALSGFANLFLSLQQFSQAMLGGKIVSKRANFNTSFIANKGIIRFKDMTIKTGLGNGAAEGLINLPKWKINTKGEINLTQSILSKVLIKKSSSPLFLPFKITNRLDDPTVKLETSELTKGGIRLPGTLNKKMDKLIKKKSVNKILEQVFPRVNSGKGKSGISPRDLGLPDNSKRQQNKKTKAEDILKGILRELVN